MIWRHRKVFDCSKLRYVAEGRGKASIRSIDRYEKSEIRSVDGAAAFHGACRLLCRLGKYDQ